MDATEPTIPQMNELSSVVWDPERSLFVAKGKDDDGPCFTTSQDGGKWDVEGNKPG